MLKAPKSQGGNKYHQLTKANFSRTTPRTAAWEGVALPPEYLLKHPQIMAKACFPEAWGLCMCFFVLLRAARNLGTASLQTVEKRWITPIQTGPFKGSTLACPKLPGPIP